MRYIKGRWIPAPKGKRMPSLRLRHILCLLLVLVAGFVIISEIALSSVTQELTDNVTQEYMAEAIAAAVEKTLNDNEFSVITEDDTGKIVSIQTDTAALNLFKVQLIENIQKKLNGTISIGVPIGSFTNMAFLNGRGFHIPLKMNFEGSVNISFESEIVSAGINQSCHRIYMTVSAQTVSQSKTFSASGTYETDFILSETVIVGEVPEIVTGLNNNS